MEKLSKCANSISYAENTLTYAYACTHEKKRYSVSNSLGCNNVNEGTERRHSVQKKKKYKKNTKCLKGFLFMCGIIW